MTDNPITYAVVRVGGKQYKVRAGDELLVDRLAVDEGKTLTLEPLLVRSADGVHDPAIARTAKVKAKVIEHVLGVKIKVFTYKPKSTFKKTKGHRSRLSRIAIESIALKEKQSGS
jgi:large subunit ribosomal protein L21